MVCCFIHRFFSFSYDHTLYTAFPFFATYLILCTFARVITHLLPVAGGNYRKDLLGTGITLWSHITS